MSRCWLCHSLTEEKKWAADLQNISKKVLLKKQEQNGVDAVSTAVKIQLLQLALDQVQKRLLWQYLLI